MRIASFILFSLLSTLASANGLPASNAAAAESAGQQPATANVSQIGAAMGGDALQCDRAVVIENTETAKAVSDKAVSDADSFASRLAELPAAARASVTVLASAHALDQQLLNRAFFAKVCERLAEKGIAAAELKPALQNLAQELGLAYPEQGTAGGQPAAPAQTATDSTPAAPPAAAPGAQPGLQIPSLTTDAPQVQAEAKTPAETAAEPSAPLAAAPLAPAAPTAPTAPSPAPITEAERAAPAPAPVGAAPELPQAPAAVPPQSAQAPVVASPPEAAPAAAPQAAASEPAPQERGIAPSAPEAPAAPPAQVAEAPAQSAAPEAAPSTTPEPAAPEAPAAPAAPPVQVAESPAPSAPEVAPPAAPETPAASAPPPAQVAEAPAPATPEPSATPVPSAPETPAASAPPPAQVAEAPAPSAPEPAPSVAPEPAATPAAPPAQIVEAPTPPPAAAPTPSAPKKARVKRPEGAVDNLGEEECRKLGVLDSCPDLNAVLDRLLERPLEYNHPDTMLLGRKTEITLVLRTDWEGKDLPAEVSEELKGLPGEVKQGLSKITRVMSAELTGREFDISPPSRQERTVVPPQPVSWSWQVSPTDTGEKKPLKLRLYAHLQDGSGTMPPILVKTLDASINVDVTTWDWVVNQARTLEPIYAIGAALLGLLTAILTYFLTRSREPAHQGGYRETTGTRDNGPVIGDLGQSATDRRAPAAAGKPDGEPLPPPAKPSGDGGPEGGGSA